MKEDFREKMKAALKDQLMSLKKEQLADVLAEYCLTVGLPYFMDYTMETQVCATFDSISRNQPLQETGDNGFVRNPIDSSASPLQFKLRDGGI